MEADGEDDAEEGMMAYRQVGRRRVAAGQFHESR